MYLKFETILKYLQNLNDPKQPDDAQFETLIEAPFKAPPKKKTNDHRLSRGFAPKGAGKSSPAPGSPSKSSESSSSGLEARMASSRCADCKQLGHWKGDPECPNVEKGKTPKFDKEKKRPEKKTVSSRRRAATTTTSGGEERAIIERRSGATGRFRRSYYTYRENERYTYQTTIHPWGRQPRHSPGENRRTMVTRRRRRRR